MDFSFHQLSVIPYWFFPEYLVFVFQFLFLIGTKQNPKVGLLVSIQTGRAGLCGPVRPVYLKQVHGFVSNDP